MFFGFGFFVDFVIGSEHVKVVFILFFLDDLLGGTRRGGGWLRGGDGGGGAADEFGGVDAGGGESGSVSAERRDVSVPTESVDGGAGRTAKSLENYHVGL